MSNNKINLETDKQQGVWQNQWQDVKSRRQKLLEDSSYRSHEHEVEMALSFVKDFDIFVDCGPGYAATESWSVADKIPNCEIIGIEAQEQCYILMKDLYPGTIYNKCISHKVGHVDGFTGSPTGKADFWLRASDEYVETGAYKKCTIESTTIDILLRDKEGQALVWADIEGSEPDMLLGSLESLKNNKIVGFFLETSPKTMYYLDKVLLPFGFKKQQYRECGTHADWLYYL